MHADIQIIYIFLIISCGIYKIRNQKLFRNYEATLLELVDDCLAYVDSFNYIQHQHLVLCKENVLSWEAPLVGTVKLNFDGTLVLRGVHPSQPGPTRTISRLDLGFKPRPEPKPGRLRL